MRLPSQHSTAAVWLFAALAVNVPVLAQDARVVSITSSSDTDGVTFVASISRPADCGTLAAEPGGGWSWWQAARADRPPRMPELLASSAWTSPAYLEFAYPGDNQDEPAGSVDPFVFVGHAPVGSATLDVTLRYPKGEGADWAMLPVHLDLASAGSAAATDAKRLAVAEANWFRFLASQSPDPGGFYSFAEIQTRRRAGLEIRSDEAATRRNWQDPANEPYALASGAIAIQEALQLDRMTNPPATAPAPTIPIAEVRSVEIASHDYDAMRGASEPVDTPLSHLAPADNWFLRFGNIAKLIELADFGDQWGSSLLRLATATGQDFSVRQRLLAQLCLSDGPVVRALGPTIIGEVAFTGSDPYLRLGSDVTAMFAVKNRTLFAAAMEPLVQQAVAGGAVRETTTIEGLSVERVRTPDRRICCYRAWIGDVCVYSNSDAAIARVARAAAGALPALADSPDFKFIRAKVFPYSAESEDGLLFLSDGFVRRAVGPEVRIAQLRRLQALTSLQMITHAQMLRGWERGPGRPTLDDLATAGYLTVSDLIDPAGGAFALDAATGTASNSYWGTAHLARPLVESPVDMVTESERDAYDAFRNQYRSYWQRYIDPVAVRIGVGPTITLETHILPLIDLSEYQRIKQFAGGPPVIVEPAKFSPPTLLRFVTRIGEGQTRRSILSWAGAFTGTNAAADWLGDWATFWIEDSDTLSALVRDAYGAEPGGPDNAMDIFRAALVGGVHVKNKLSLATFLVGLRAVIDQSAPNTVIYTTLEPRAGVTIVKISPDPAGDLAADLNREAADDQGKPRIDPALYYATIGDGFYLATQQASLERLIDAQDQPAAPAEAAAPPADRANLFVYAAPGAAAGAKPAISTILELQARRAATSNLAQIELLARCGLLADRDIATAAPVFLGYSLVDPDGAAYSFNPATGIASSAMHNTRWSIPAELSTLPPTSPLAALLDQLKTVSASLRFTDDGLETTVRIRRE